MEAHVVARVYQEAAAGVDGPEELEQLASWPIRRETRAAWEDRAGRKLDPEELEMIRELFLAEYLRAIGRA